MKPNKYMGNGKRYPDGVQMGPWVMTNGEWKLLPHQFLPNEPVKVPKKSNAKLLWGGGVALALYIALCIWAASQLIPRLS